MNRELSARSENQKPGLGRGSGISGKLIVQPDLRNITIDDLREPQRLDVLYRQAVRAGLLLDVPAERLKWFAAAERAIQLGTGNPCGLFVRLFREGLWHYATNHHEDAARMKLMRLVSGETVRDDAVPLASPTFAFGQTGRLSINLESMKAIVHKELVA